MSSSAPPAAAPARKGASAALGWLVTIGFNVVAPILIYNHFHGHTSEFVAVLLSGLGPVVDIAIYLAWHRRVDEFALVSLVFVLLTVVVSFIGPHDAKLLLAKDSVITGLFGVLCLVTLFAPKPLMFYFGRKFATDGTPEAVAWWNGLWQYPGFRTVQRNLTIGWGVGFVLEALVRLVCVYTLSNSQVVSINSFLPYVVIGGLVFWTVMYGKRSRARGEAARAAMAAGAAAEGSAAV